MYFEENLHLYFWFVYQLEQFELIFEKLKLEANVKDIEEFIDLFNSQDESNKDLFEQADELSDEVMI